MSEPLILPPADHTFLDVPFEADPTAVATPYALFAVPHGPCYQPADWDAAAGGADRVRAEAFRQEYGAITHHYDFDFGGPLFPDGTPTLTDLGNLVGSREQAGAVAPAVTATTRDLLQQGAVPLVLGGLDWLPPMVVAGFDGIEQVHVLHVDAHLDFRDEVDGIRDGYSSPIRRIRELACVDRIVQVGMRSVGSARPAEVADALAAGNRIVTARELHDHGAAAVAASLRRDRRWVVTIDCDGLDPAIAPGVSYREPGGLTYHQITTLLHALAGEGLVAALVMTEYAPAHDIDDLTALTITRLLMTTMGTQRR